MSETADNDEYLQSKPDATELSAFLGYVDLSPADEAAMWREHDRAVVEYEDFFEDDQPA